MKERPILFSSEMVRAILEGRKTQTRRVAKVEGCHIPGMITPVGFHVPRLPAEHVAYCPYGQPGDRLWVRETWIPVRHGSYEALDRDAKPRSDYDAVIQYAADPVNGYHSFDEDYRGKWRPSIFMPRWASRITLEVKKVRVERVQEISKQDAIAEGISVLPLQSSDDPSAWYQSAPGVHQDRSSRGSFMQLWDSINAKRGFGWEVNPWVWVIEFERVKQHA